LRHMLEASGIPHDSAVPGDDPRDGREDGGDSLTDGGGAHDKARRRAANLARRVHVEELVDLVPRQVLQIVELTDVHALLGEQVDVSGIEVGRVLPALAGTFES